MPVKKSAVRSQKSKVVVSSLQTKRSVFSVPVYSLTGSAAGNLELPKEIFGVEINKSLLSQAMRVYLNNQKGHWSNTKTRGEVEGSTRKIFKQKGTGRARHGAVRAPIFVGGGKAMGTKSRKVTLDLPKKMKKAALVSALSLKAKDKEIMGLSNLDKATGKTKEVASLFKKLNAKSALVVVDKPLQNLQRSLNNLKNVKLLESKQLNAYEVIKAKNIFLTKEAVLALQGETKNA